MGTTLAVFAGTSFNTNLWVTDGTAAGTSELSVAGAASSGLDPAGLTLHGNEVQFTGVASSVNSGLWVTDGTAAGTSELSVAVTFPTGRFHRLDPKFTVLGNEVLFTGVDSSGQLGLWGN
jgi:ELWxxDGT repeat protein